MGIIAVGTVQSELPKISNILSKLSVAQPVLTVSLISDIAEECGISYNNAVRHIQACRIDGTDIKHCIFNLMQIYRPKL